MARRVVMLNLMHCHRNPARPEPKIECTVTITLPDVVLKIMHDLEAHARIAFYRENPDEFF